MSKTKEEHRHITHEVLKVLQKNKLFLKVEKCEFETLEMEYLGVIISEGSIRMDPVKIAGIAEWPVPAKKQQLQSFLSFTNFYWCFIKGYSKVIKPMTQLTGNNPWKWGNSATEHIQGVEKATSQRGGISDTHGGRQVLRRGGHKRRSNRGSSIPRTRWQMAPSCLPIQVPHGYGTKL